MNTHLNTARANQTYKWSGSDNQSNWNTNYKNHSTFLDSVKDFQYTYNKDGFRTHEFDSKPCVIALGCSHTEGVGVAEHHTWPAKLEQKLQKPVYNLGVGGTGIDTCYRLMKYYATTLNVDAVCLNIPPERFEIYTGKFWETHTVQNIDRVDFMKQWFTNEANTVLHQDKLINAIHWFCSTNNLKLATTLWDDKEYLADDIGRDLLHNGPKYHENVSTGMHKQLQ